MVGDTGFEPVTSSVSSIPRPSVDVPGRPTEHEPVPQRLSTSARARPRCQAASQAAPSPPSRRFALARNVEHHFAGSQRAYVHARSRCLIAPRERLRNSAAGDTVHQLVSHADGRAGRASGEIPLAAQQQAAGPGNPSRRVWRTDQAPSPHNRDGPRIGGRTLRSGPLPD